jgi:hypothetical protein
MEDVPFVPILIGAVLVVCVAYETRRRRDRLREVFYLFDRAESKVADALESMVKSGQLKPFVPAQPA